MPALQMDPGALSPRGGEPSSVSDMLQSARPTIRAPQRGRRRDAVPIQVASLTSRLKRM